MKRIDKMRNIRKKTLWFDDSQSKTHFRDALTMNHVFESPYTSPNLDILHSILGMNKKEKKLTKNDVCYMTDDELVLSLL